MGDEPLSDVEADARAKAFGVMMRAGHPITRWNNAIDAYERALWRPISEAPRNPLNPGRFGPWVQLHEAGKVPVPGRWYQDTPKRGWWASGARVLIPTHWRPLPPGPGDAP